MKRAIVTTIFLAASVSILTGCGGQSETEKAQIVTLQAKVQQLEQDNTQLRSKLASAESVQTLLTTMAKASPAAQAPVATPLSERSQNTGSNESGTAGSANHPKFTDLAETAQRPMIEELSAIGLFDGSSNNFEPDKKISRGEYAKWLFNASNALLPLDKQIHMAPSAPPFFSDLNASDPNYKYVQALANAGYSVGYDDKTFKGNQPITREEMISMKVGVDGGKTFEPYRGQMAFVWKFSDSKDVDERFTGYIHQDYYTSGTYGSNIQRAFGKVGTFHPKTAATRAEAAGTLWQIGQFGDHGHTAAAILQKRREAAAS